jgi:hypothetical protein
MPGVKYTGDPHLRRLRTWQDAAAECDLQVVKASDRSARLTARADSVEVQIEAHGDIAGFARIQVRVPGLPDFYNVKIRREPRFWQTQEIEIGDRPFDRTFFIEGPPLSVFTLLDAETRRLLLRANAESRVEISAGVLRAEGIANRRVPYVLSLLVAIGRRFVQSLDVPRRLAENACRDPRTRVRLQNLLLLIREFPRYPETLEALRTACSDRNSEIRLWAARELGAEGRDVLLVLSQRTVVDRVSAEAVSILGRELPVKRTRALLDRSLRSRRIQTARACLEALGQSEDAAAVEPSLIRALQREEADLRVAAATALGRVGTAAAVLPLKDAAERAPKDKDLRRAIRQAVAEIQSRLHGASPGQLSLSGAEGGELSLPDAEAGQLSFSSDPAGQLSFSSDPAGQLSLPSDPAGQRLLPKER